MARLVGGFCVPHDPLITGAPEAADPKQANKVMQAFGVVRDAIAGLKADTVIVIGDDHFAMFDTGCQPTILIGIGDLEGPIEDWLRIPRRAIPNNTPLAEHIMNFGFERGFDWAVAKTLSLDHSTMVPTHLCLPDQVRMIPIYVAAGMTPLIRAKRCRELGAMIGAAVQAWPSDERVVILGTGGISHWVGTPEMGKVNPEFDRSILVMAEKGDVDGLVALSDAQVLENGGNGAWEVRNWIVAMAAMPRCKAKVIAYEAVVPWITGLGFAALEAA